MENLVKKHQQDVERFRIESEEEYQRRVDFLKGMKDQYPKTFSDAEIAREKGQLISSQESQRMIYNDKLIRCD